MLGPITLSFAEHLRHAFTPITNRMQEGVSILDEVIAFYDARIRAERVFVRALDKIRQKELPQSEIGSIAEALRAIKIDLANEVASRFEFVRSLDEEVFQPLVAFRATMSQSNNAVAADTSRKVKRLRQERFKFAKMKSKFDKAAKERQSAETSMITARRGSKHQLMKLVGRSNSARKKHAEAQPKYDSAQVTWDQEQSTFNEDMTSILTSMQAQEKARLQCLSDCTLKTAVFTTNYYENRRYDILEIAQQMSQTNPEQDMQELIKQFLREHPGKRSEPLIPLEHGRNVNPIEKLHDTLATSDLTSSLPCELTAILISFVGYVEDRMPLSFLSIPKQLALTNQENQSTIVFTTPLQQSIERQWCLKFMSMPTSDPRPFMTRQFVVQLFDFGEVYHISTRMESLSALYVSQTCPKFDEERHCVTWEMDYHLIPGRTYLIAIQPTYKINGDNVKPLGFETDIPVPSGFLDPDDRESGISVDLSYCSTNTRHLYDTFNRKRYALGFSVFVP